MTGQEFQYDLKDLKLPVEQIGSVMGYKPGESPEIISGLIPELLEESGSICSIRAEFKIFDTITFNNELKSVFTGHLWFNIDKLIYGQLKKSESIAVFLCTAGPGIGIRSREEMQNGDLLKGYIYDVIGSEIVEAAADLMQDELERQLAAEGKKITNRFSPGYCGWKTEEQHKLFSLMPDNYCGIRLTPSALMDPVKSISGIIGIGKNVKRLPYTTCTYCDMKDCIYRKSEKTK